MEVSKPTKRPYYKWGDHPWPCGSYVWKLICPRCGWPDFTHKANNGV